jgi:hypothetical protein
VKSAKARQSLDNFKATSRWAQEPERPQSILKIVTAPGLDVSNSQQKRVSIGMPEVKLPAISSKDVSPAG